MTITSKGWDEVFTSVKQVYMRIVDTSMAYYSICAFKTIEDYKKLEQK